MINYGFAETEFYVLIVFSLILPISLYGYMMWKRAISRKTVMLLGSILIVIAGVNVVLLRRLVTLATVSSTIIGDSIFKSELSVSLYLLPILYAGIGVNMLSHLLINHLTDAEKRFDQGHK